MRVDVFTIFPDMLEGFCSGSLLGKARTAGLLDLRVHDIRDAVSRRAPVRRRCPLRRRGRAWCSRPDRSSMRWSRPLRPGRCTSSGRRGGRFDQTMADELLSAASAPGGGFSLLCGRYEGVDQRVADHLVDGELSIGDYVLAGGEVGRVGGGRDRDPPASRRHGQRGVGRRGEFRGGLARISPLHPAGPVPGVGRSGGPSPRRPRPGRPLAPGHGASSDDGAAP